MSFVLIPYAEIDPTNSYKHLTEQQLLDWCGLLPHFVANDTYGDKDALSAINEQYEFGSGHYIEGGTIDDAGVYHFPDDEPLAPLAIMIRTDFETRQNEKVFIYPYGLIAVIGKTGTHVQRMD